MKMNAILLGIAMALLIAGVILPVPLGLLPSIPAAVLALGVLWRMIREDRQWKP